MMIPLLWLLDELGEFFVVHMHDFIALLWFFLALALLFFELFNPGLYYALACAAGACIAAIAAWYELALFSQLFIWAVSSLIFFFILRYCGSFLQAKQYHSNYEGIVGKQGVVTLASQVIGQGPARVKIQGDYWPARELHGQALKEGDIVLVIDLKGNTLIVQVKK